MTIKVTRQNGELRIATPFSRSFVDDLKREIPFYDRAWSAPHWVVNDKHASRVLDIIEIHYNVRPKIEDIAGSNDPTIQIFRLEYLGRCKDQNTYKDEQSASGFANGSWSVLFPESVLKDYFQAAPTTSAPSQKTNPDTYYSTLGLIMTATADEIKKSFRRLARQWHPDVNKGDPDAESMFKKINEANSILSDTIKRKKYDYMLNLTMKMNESATNVYSANDYAYDSYDPYGYRAPLKCGMVVAECKIVLGRFVALKIFSWDDIVENGKTMVSIWSMEDQKFVIKWV